MRNPKLIDQLSANLEPVRPLSPLRNTLVWIGGSLTTIAISLMLMNRREISQILEHPTSVISGIWLFLNSVFLAFSANLLGTPGRRNQRLALFISLVFYLLLIGILFGLAISFKSPIVLSGTACVIAVIGLSIMPLVFFFRIARKLAPTSPWLTGLLSGFAACALGAFGLGFSCIEGDPLHLLLFHLVFPMLIIGGVGAFLGKSFLKW